MSRRTLSARRRAAALVVALAALLLVALVGGQLMRTLARSQRQSRQHHSSLQALWLAEAGLDRAASRLASDSTYTGETWRPVISDNSASGTSAVAGRVEIVVETGSVEASHRQIRVEAYFPDDPVRRVTHTRQQDFFLRGEIP